VPNTDRAGDSRTLVLDIEGLTHCLGGKNAKDQFVLSVPQRLRIPRGSFVTLLGPSGCGKTTLLSILGLLRRPSDLHGLVRFSMWVEESGTWKEYDLKEAYLGRRSALIEKLRRRYIGFALQSGELLSALTVRENIAAPLQLNGVVGPQCWDRVAELMRAFGLSPDRPVGAAAGSWGSVDDSNLAYRRVNKLSGGEYQRVALARAIAHRPALVFVDEPTANLNRELARHALLQLQRLQREAELTTTVLMITHEVELAEEFADIIIHMKPQMTETGAAGEVVDIRAKADAECVLEFDGPAATDPLADHYAPG